MEINGLVPLHAYSVLKVVEYKEKRFVLLRNPWGNSEWTGPWSDGSPEWTDEWRGALELLDHRPGNDGVFVMEYRDFLKQFAVLESTKLFDESWVVSSYWMQLRGLKIDRAWSYGDVSWTFAISEKTPAVIVLQQIDTRYFMDHAGWLQFNFDFVLFKKGSKEPIARPVKPMPASRSVNLEIELEPGEYVVHARIDIDESCRQEWYHESVGSWNRRKVARQKAERAIAYSIASNFRQADYIDQLPVPLEVFADRDVVEVGIEAVETSRVAYLRRKTLITASSKTHSRASTGWFGHDGETNNHEEDGSKGMLLLGGKEVTTEPETDSVCEENPSEGVSPHGNVHCDGCGSPINGPRFYCVDSRCSDYNLCELCSGVGIHPREHRLLRLETPEEADKFLGSTVPHGTLNDDENPSLVLGLRVYTHKESPATIEGFIGHIRNIKQSVKSG
ncbi:hypothetical protein NLI96_g8895 [Meripilus lineatus]|uniref:Uncharacterized protein n=1 Tax=Meripilus lineatus TaxID=2056292 RepID=A0AAD5UWL5_9APHY|nr:hypothetical protein NLI96_g8895 [Physisporinus lineatus]